jgi:hypothetical protein
MLAGLSNHLVETTSKNGHRGSIDGQQKLQAEFARLQREKDDQEDATANGLHEVIDWGVSNHLVLVLL